MRTTPVLVNETETRSDGKPRKHNTRETNLNVDYSEYFGTRRPPKVEVRKKKGRVKDPEKGQNKGQDQTNGQDEVHERGQDLLDDQDAIQEEGQEKDQDNQ